MDIITNVLVCVQSLCQLAFYHVVNLKKIKKLSYFMFFVLFVGVSKEESSIVVLFL